MTSNIETWAEAVARTLPPLDIWTAIGIVMLLALLRHLSRQLFEPDVKQCPAEHQGCRCVHLEDHPGSHRDEFGDYWN